MRALYLQEGSTYSLLSLILLMKHITDEVAVFIRESELAHDLFGLLVEYMYLLFRSSVKF